METVLDRPRLLSGLLSRIGKFSLSGFDDRLVFQKTVYLLQAFGIFLGYSFGWYIRGPYSPQLTKEGFGLAGDLTRYPTHTFRNQQTEDRFLEFLEFVGPYKTDVLWLETAASAHFLVKVHGETDRRKIFRKIKAKQPHVTKNLFDRTWKDMRETGIL